ncbi:MAG: hypothetical protein QMB53_03235, partial [Eubacteriales bacterium]
LRSIAMTGSGAAFAGVSATVAAVILINNTRALVLGDIIRANKVTVLAKNDYPTVFAATVAAAGGIAGVSASVVVIVNSGTLEASIGGGAHIRDTAAVEVKSDVNNHMTAIAVAIAGGGVAVNAGIAAAVNRMTVNTYIGQGVQIIAPELTALHVLTTSSTTANTWLIGASVGGVAVGVGVAVSILLPTIRTFIGLSPDGVNITGASTGSAQSVISPDADIVVLSDVFSKAEGTTLSFSAGTSYAIAGNILLAFNRTKAVTGISAKNIAAGSILIAAGMDATADTFIGSAAVGSIAAGVSIAVSLLAMDNQALLDFTGYIINADSVRVIAAKYNLITAAITDNNAVSKASVVSAAIGGTAIGINTAVADNKASNTARMTGGIDGELQVAALLMAHAQGSATAEATIYGLNIGAASVAASFAVAIMRHAQTALVEGGLIYAGELQVQSVLNDGQVNPIAVARMHTGGGAVISVTVNVAVAYGRGTTLAKVKPYALSMSGKDILVKSKGNAGVFSEIKQSVTGGVRIGLLMALSFSQGSFEAVLEIPDTSVVQAGNVTVATDSATWAHTHLDPSAMAVDFAWISVDINLALAKVTALNTAKITGGSLQASSVTVKADGQATAYAKIATPLISAGKYKMAANVLLALLNAEQKASIEGTALTMSANGGISVISNLNKGSAFTAKTEMGGVLPVGIELALISGKVNIAIALADAVNSALLSGVAIAGAGSVAVKTDGRSDAIAGLPAISTVAAAGIGINIVYAKGNGTYTAQIDTQGKTIKAGSITVDTLYTATADARTAQPTQGIGSINISLLTIKANYAGADVGIKASASILGSGSLDVAGALIIKTEGTGYSLAQVDASIVDINGVSVATNTAIASLNAQQKAFIENASLKAGSVSITSNYNQGTAQGAKALVGGTGVSVNLVGGHINIVKAIANAANHAYINGATLQEGTGAVKLLAQGTSYATATQLGGSGVSLVGFGILQATAKAGGDFSA